MTGLLGLQENHGTKSALWKNCGAQYSQLLQPPKSPFGWTVLWLPASNSSPYSITEHRVPKLIPVLGSQPAGDVSHKPGGRLPLLFARPAVTPTTLGRGLLPILLLGEFRHDGCEQFAQDCYPTASQLRFEPGPSAPESSTLTTRLASHPARQ